MSTISGETVFNVIKLLNPTIEFTSDEKRMLIEHFKKNEMNQFYHIIVAKICAAKSFTVGNNAVMLNVSRILADKMGKGSTPINTDEEIIVFAETGYKVLFALDIQEFYNNGF